MKIFNICLKFNIDLSIQWIPREMNEIADTISKFSSTDEWEVTERFFQCINDIWGPHDIDRFATFKNRKTKRYNSLFVDFESEAIDCFTQDWSGCNNWLVPPICMVSRVILHILHCNATASLIVPKWCSSAFWPILFNANYEKREFVHDVLEFDKGQDIFTCKNTSKCVFSGSRFHSKTLAIRFVSK